MPVQSHNLNLKLTAAILLLTVATAQFYWLCAFKGFSIDVSLADALGSYLLLYGIFLFLEFGFSQKLPPIARFGIIGGQSIGLAAIWIFTCEWTLNHLSDNKDYALFWNDTFYIRALVGWILLFNYNLFSYYVKLADKYDSYTEQKEQNLRLRNEAELFKLRHQLQPHFLFNSLNSINALIGKQPQQARTMVQQLSEFLRHTLKKEDNMLISVKEEMDDLHIYLSIEQVRFGHRLVVAEQIAAESLVAKIPAFLIQPLVENAIKFGLYGTIGIVNIEVSGKVQNNQFVFSITNPYDPSAVNVKGTGFGIESIRRRLYLLFARNDLLSIQKFEKPVSESDTEENKHFFTATIHIPLAPEIRLPEERNNE